MVVIKKEKKWVNDFVNVCSKSSTQRMCYINNVCPMQTHDMATVDDRTGPVIGGKALDDEFNHSILPPINPWKRGRSQSNRRKSYTEGVRSKICSKCGELGHYKNTCRNPRTDFDADYEAIL